MYFYVFYMYSICILYVFCVYYSCILIREKYIQNTYKIHIQYI